MKTYLFFKNQIQGYRDVQETVKTVEKISASRIHAMKGIVASQNAYTEKLESVLRRLLHFHPSYTHPLLTQKRGDRGLVIVTGEKGLVGSLWHDTITAYLQHKASYQFIISVGAKGDQYLREEYVSARHSFSFNAEVPTTEELHTVTRFLFDLYTKKTVGSLDVLYPTFVSLSEHQPQIIPYLPFTFPTHETPQLPVSDGMPIFEPSKSYVIARFLEKYIGIVFSRIILEAKLSELSARTITTEHAAEKTNDVVRSLNLLFLKDRRTYLTAKQLENFMTHTRA